MERQHRPLAGPQVGPSAPSAGPNSGSTPNPKALAEMRASSKMSVMVFPKVEIEVEEKQVKKATFAYVLAILLVAIATIAGQILIKVTLDTHSQDSTKINVGGRQRMLSQKLTLETFALVYYAQCSPNATSAGIMTPQIRTLRRSAIGLWNASHTDLQAGSTALGIKAETDAGVLSLYNTANTYFAQMLALSMQFDAAVVTNPAETGPILDQLVVLRQQFLLKMNEIVNAYQIISDGRIYQLVVIESVLLGFTLIVLLLEVVFVIVPAVRRMRQLRADISSMD